MFMKKQTTQQLPSEQLTKIGILALKLQGQGVAYKEASELANKQIRLEYESSKEVIDEKVTSDHSLESSQIDSDEYMVTNSIESSMQLLDEHAEGNLESSLRDH